MRRVQKNANRRKTERLRPLKHEKKLEKERTDDPSTNKQSKTEENKTGNKEWDEVFNQCFYENMRTVMWSHHCMHDGYIYVARGQECSWCGAEEEHAGVPNL